MSNITLFPINYTNLYFKEFMPLILQSSGSPPSAFQVPYDSFREQSKSNATDSLEIDSSADGLQMDKIQNLDYDFQCFFLSTQRLDLYRSIDFRCEDMLLGIQWSSIFLPVSF